MTDYGGDNMALDFCLESASTIFLLRDWQGKVIKSSQKGMDYLDSILDLGNNLYYNPETEQKVVI